jgi:hypothetical protein
MPTMSAVGRVAKVLGYPCAIDEMLPTPRLKPFALCPLIMIPLNCNKGYEMFGPQRREMGREGWNYDHTRHRWGGEQLMLSYYDLSASVEQITSVQQKFAYIGDCLMVPCRLRAPGLRYGLDLKAIVSKITWHEMDERLRAASSLPSDERLLEETIKELHSSETGYWMEEWEAW